MIVQTKERYAGDLERAIVRLSSKDQGVWFENYLRETDLLAQQLWVANYRRESSLRYRFEVAAGEYINLLPGVADTVAVSRMEATIRYGGSFGY
ncbi:hypothetical protein [Chroococcidiopsis sp. CCMEE 29]|uniref:hypothetical protein n=1 Tax=Chroococcidiopsis sp. CCMEE 29 TaxID=155894 RepID=UPI0020228975|nr:hypothetical protein [Chroococcidiopsis sp. CCMEE 29]